MHALNLIGAFAVIAAAKPKPPPGCFQIEQFYVNAIPHSLSVSYNFNSTTSYDNNAVSCSAYAYTNPQIGPVPLSNCSEPASKWFFNVTSDGFLLDVQRYVKQGKKTFLLEGQKTWPSSVAMVRHSPPDNPFPYEYLAVPSEFDIPYTVRKL